MIGDSRSEVRTLPRFPNVKIVDLFFNEGFDEKRRESAKEIFV